MELVLNDISLTSAARNVHEARERMKALIFTIRSAAGFGVARAMRVKEDLGAVALSVGYSISQWRNDNEVEIDLRRYFSSIVSKAPYLSADDEQRIFQQLQISECMFDGEPALGLGIALITSSLAISIKSDTKWNRDQVIVELLTLTDKGDLISEQAIVKHSSDPSHVDAHKNWIAERLTPKVVDGHQLWNERREIFPHLRFCERGRDYVLGLMRGEERFYSLLDRLRDLESYFAGWTSGAFDPSRIPGKITGESDTNIKDNVNDLIIYCPDGKKREFRWHARMTPGALRIYFFPDQETRTGIIGYIGRKLGT